MYNESNDAAEKSNISRSCCAEGEYRHELEVMKQDCVNRWARD